MVADAGGDLEVVEAGATVDILPITRAGTISNFYNTIFYRLGFSRPDTCSHRLTARLMVYVPDLFGIQITMGNPNNYGYR